MSEIYFFTAKINPTQYQLEISDVELLSVDNFKTYNETGQTYDEVASQLNSVKSVRHGSAMFYFSNTKENLKLYKDGMVDANAANIAISLLKILDKVT